MPEYLTSTIATSFLTEPQLDSLHSYKRFTPDQFSACGVTNNLPSRINLGYIWDNDVAATLRPAYVKVLEEPLAYGVVQFDLGLLSRVEAQNSPFSTLAYTATRRLMNLLKEKNDGSIAIVLDNKGRNYAAAMYMDACDSGSLELSDRSYITRHYSWDKLMEAVEPLLFPKQKEP